MFRPQKKRRDIRRKGGDYKPVSYKSYFDSFTDVPIDGTEDSFRVYLSGFEDTEDPPGVANVPLLMLLHGAGYSGLTWSLFTKHIRELCHCKVAAVDLRGHGNTKTTNEDDLSTSTICNDIGNVFKGLMKKVGEIPRVILIGHSMGGALAVHCAHNLREIIQSIVAVVVIDVVEGTALNALQNMNFVLSNRPTTFKSLPYAIEWCCRSGQTRNQESAKVSMPGQLKNLKTGETATAYVEDYSEEGTSDGQLNADFIPEDSIVETSTKSAPELGGENKFGWRINLQNTEPYWKGWFVDLSSLFLSAPVHAKMLLLAGVDRLDKDLTVGQMQGKFQMQVIPHCGHAIHEDDPDKVAEAIAAFVIRNRFTTPKSEFDRPFPSC